MTVTCSEVALHRGSGHARGGVATDRLSSLPRRPQPHHLCKRLEELTKAHAQRGQDRRQSFHRNTALSAF